MKRSARVIWIGSVFSTIIIAAVAGLVVYFTAFRSSTDPNTTVETTSENNSPGAPTAPNSSPSSSPSADESLENANGYDHLSHAVPGDGYTTIDRNKDGKDRVQLDGSRSHTHFYSEGPPAINGKLISFVWFNKETRKHLASEAKPILEFPIGKTEIGLTVRDNSRDSHTAYTTVNVLPPIFPGAYCFFYPSASPPGTISLAADRKQAPLPTFGANSTVNFPSASDFPDEAGSAFQARCVFSVKLQAEKSVKISVDHTGPLKILVDAETVLSEASSEKTTSQVSPTLAAGDHSVQMLYSSPASGSPSLVLSSEEAITYDDAEVPPILRRIEPRESILDGGGDVRVDGINILDIEIEIDGKVIKIDEEKSSEDSIYFEVPKATSAKIVQVRAKNLAGYSNSLQFEYRTDGKPPIKFKQSFLRTKSGKFDVQMITGIKYGPDHRYYVSAIDNRVHSFETDSNLVVQDICHGAALGTNTSILGMAFNPVDTEVKLYVSASVLHWRVKERLNHPMAWANGEILIVKKDTGGGCLGKSGDSIITGLPVSNHDHGINGLEFDNDGNLRIQVGGFTNAGVNDMSAASPGTPAHKIGGKLGGVPANPLSGASLMAELSKPGFNGKITYNDTNPQYAVQTGGDVFVYSSGFRNSFGIAIHSNGQVYATDNGASKGFGAKSLSCTTEEALTNGHLADELVKVVKGKYAGHPNRNRGRRDARQCEFRGPDEESDEFYEAPIVTFESSTDGIIEYTANTFDGQLKNDLLCSKFTTDQSEGKVYRVQLDESGDAVTKSPDELWGASGLSIVMSPYGELLMPRVFKREVLVLKPDVGKGLSPEFRAVVPFRGPRKGGNWVMVTGERLAAGATATFDGKACSSVKEVSEDKRSFLCQVPPAEKAGARVKVGLKFSDSSLDVAAEEGRSVDYMYMNL